VTIRPVPGPWRIPPPFRPRYVDTPDAVEWVALCDRCGMDAPWRKGKDAARPTCQCPCQPQEGAA
jgi:hypothetical protein